MFALIAAFLATAQPAPREPARCWEVTPEPVAAEAILADGDSYRGQCVRVGGIARGTDLHASAEDFRRAAEEGRRAGIGISPGDGIVLLDPHEVVVTGRLFLCSDADGTPARFFGDVGTETTAEICARGGWRAVLLGAVTGPLAGDGMGAPDSVRRKQDRIQR